MSDISGEIDNLLALVSMTERHLSKDIFLPEL